MRNAGVRFPWAAASSRPLARFLIFKKGDFYDASEKDKNGKNKKSRDAYSGFDLSYWQSLLYRWPVFKEESSQTLGEVLLRLMKSESEKL